MFINIKQGNMYLGSDNFGVTPISLASVMDEEIPEVERATAIQEELPA